MMSFDESYSYYQRKLRLAFPFHREDVLLCSKCLPRNNHNVVAYQERFRSDFDEFQRLSCNVCKSCWYVCGKCSNQRSHYAIDDMMRHIRMKHRIEDVAQMNGTRLNNDEFHLSYDSCADDRQGNLHNMRHASDCFPYCNQQQEAYFRSNKEILKGDSTHGLRHLVANAMHKSTDDEFLQRLSIDHVMFHCHIALLASRLTPIEKEQQCKSFHHLVALFRKNTVIDEYLVPTSINVLNRRYLKSKYSIMQNLPRPDVRTISRHGYISLKACVADLLGRHNMELEEIILDKGQGKCVRTIGQCKRAQDFITNYQRSQILGY